MICPDECAACHGTPAGSGRVGTNDRARLIPADDTLYAIARELVRTVTNKVTTDWALRENVRAHLRVPIRIIATTDTLATRRSGAALTVRGRDCWIKCLPPGQAATLPIGD